MMRLVLILLAFYTITLSFVPCQDEASEEGHSTSSFVTAGDQPHPAKIDLCSPFCVCSCCAGITLQPEFTAAAPATTFIVFKEIIFAYTPGSMTGDLGSIWQPPRV
jgi:hypothetical protein